MIFRLVTSFAMLALLATGCTESRQITRSGTTPIGRDFVNWYTTWTGSASETHLYFNLRDRGGKVEVCGAVLTNGTRLIRSVEPQHLNNNFLKVGETTILNSLYFFNRLPPQEGEFEVWAVMGQTANCAVTDVDWDPAFKVGDVKFGLRPGRVRL